MQEILLILSRCQNRRMSPRTQKVFFRFHFKGFYSGVKVREIHVYPGGAGNLEKGRDYLLWVRRIMVKETVLEVELLKYKEIK